MEKGLNSILAAWLGFLGGVITMLIVIAVALSLSSCAASRPLRALAALPPDPLAASFPGLPAGALAALPPYLEPAPAGSTPRQARQWQRAQARNLARAGVLPTKVKNSSVATAPGATAINRPASAVATAAGSVATDARKAGQRGGASAVGPGAVATATSRGLAWWWYLVAAVAGAVVWEYVSSQVSPLRAVLKWRP